MASYTKKAIRDAFIKMLNERPLNQITVRDIVDTCGVDMTNYKEGSAYAVFGKAFYSLKFVCNEDRFGAICRIYAFGIC